MNFKGLLLRLSIVPFCMAAFMSCNKNNEEAFEVFSDVYYINKIVDNEVRTAVVYYVFGNKEITSATATPPGGGTVELVKSQSLWFTWFKEPEIEEFTLGYPTEGTYNFEITSVEGEVLHSSDEMNIDTLAVPVIAGIEYNSSKLGYNVTWEEIENAHAFRVNVKNSEGKFIFSSSMFYDETEPVTSYEVLEESENWIESPLDGQTYSFQIQAIRFDSDANQYNYIYNFEEISIGETEVVWGN